MIWAADMDQALIAGWTAGLPSPQIAALVGCGVTAAAVRGRARDLSLPERAEQMVWAGKYKGRAPVRKTKAPPPALKGLGPLSRPKPWADREFGECCFPVGPDHDLMCCAGPIPAGARRPYCLHHLASTVAHDAA